VSRENPSRAATAANVVVHRSDIAEPYDGWLRAAVYHRVFSAPHLPQRVRQAIDEILRNVDIRVCNEIRFSLLDCYRGSGGQRCRM
jgi:hypothetical protein